MKNFRFLSIAFIAILTCAVFTACGGDDDEDNYVPTSSELVGTSWYGTNSKWGYSISVNITSTSKCTIYVYTKTGALESYGNSSYTYNSTTGEFETSYDGDNITGKVNGNTLTVTDRWGTYKLQKQSDGNDNNNEDENTSAPTLSELVGTSWKGTNSTYGYSIKVNITSTSKCTIYVYNKKGALESSGESSFTYNNTTGKFATTYGGDNITGIISGNTMTVTDYWGTYILSKI